MNNIATLNVILRDTTPPIWRRVAVPADITLVQSHGAIPIAMDWTDTVSGGPKPEEEHPPSAWRSKRALRVILWNV